MAVSITQLLGDAWGQALRETPAANWYWGLGYGPKSSYRDYLDQPKINHYGEVIPRIVLVRNNIRRLGRVRPNLP